ncbi:MAG: 3-hydroxyacyl-CoA dehydrogenase family protein [Deltaproteobacteria bacterium]|nr:3-hydroxyacyl-CoA dehydrogenase family protein [Deltaproteobacteria bacterium]
MSDVHNIAVIGAGTMGAGIAQVAALSFFDVVLFDSDTAALDKGKARIIEGMQKGAVKLQMSGADVAIAQARLTTNDKLADAVKDRDLVIEAVPEDLALKRRLFTEIAKAAPETSVLATNTSSLSVAAIAEAVADPSRVIGMHFFNPPFIMKLLEIVRAPQTSDATYERARKVGERMGREMIVVRDSPGFATSRLGVVLALEAMRILEAGVASAEDIDKAMEHGYKHQMGPLRTTDLVGLDVRLAIAQHLHTTLGGDQYRPPQILERLVKEGKLGKKSGQGFFRWEK